MPKKLWRQEKHWKEEGMKVDWVLCLEWKEEREAQRKERLQYAAVAVAGVDTLVEAAAPGAAA